ncbi:hypothetical protein COOONC_19027, partial [Cooperia oncophora]
RVHKVPLLEKIFGFIFDVILASQTTTLPLTIVIYNEKLQEQFRRLLGELHPAMKFSSRHTGGHLTDLEGKNMKIESHEETRTYFDQLRAAWY